MADTFVKIASVTVGSGGAATIDFSSIPSTYTDLTLRISARQDSSTVAYSNLRFNGSTTGYSYRSLQGDGSGASSASGSTATYGVTNLSTWTANTFNNIELYIPNYAGSNYKSWSSNSVTEANISTVYSDFVAGLWSNTAAINQITLYPNGGNFVQYSTAILYGIKNS